MEDVAGSSGVHNCRSDEGRSVEIPIGRCAPTTGLAFGDHDDRRTFPPEAAGRVEELGSFENVRLGSVVVRQVGKRGLISGHQGSRVVARGGAEGPSRLCRYELRRKKS